MRQFDVFICPSEKQVPPFTDRDLEWFFCNDINQHIDESEAEWIVFSSPEINIDRTFLNSLAECIQGYPMVDAFAPRLRTPHGQFINGLRLDSKQGFAEIENDAELRFVAAPHPKLAAFSRRIVLRTGRLDNDLPSPLRLADYCLRMLHAGGKMFHVPYLVAEANQEIQTASAMVCDKSNTKFLAETISKNLSISSMASFALHHPATLFSLFKQDKAFKEKRQKATDLSKLTDQVLADISRK